ncbi:response regulator [Viridibacterium curvum]|uniref:Response regulatory domain-containing protein n=1 Tax=Viridibacterium curvum TaxID=1101404 RepID=A0ABP9R4X0_9RHOO
MTKTDPSPPLSSGNDDADMAGANILVVDDDRATARMHSAILGDRYNIQIANSGEAALQACEAQMPDLMLLDIDMPGMNGFETCRRLREITDIPILFATGHASPEEHLKAFDAGGSDIFVKPVSAEILSRKVKLAIRQHQLQRSLLQEKDSLHRMAMNFLSSASENGALLQFIRSSLKCRSYEELASHFVEAARTFGVQCSVIIRHNGNTTTHSSRGEITELELAAINQLSSMGRQVAFRNRLAINYATVTTVISNMPENDPELAGRIRDNMTIVTETAEALAESVGMRRESAERAESMQSALGDIFTTLEGLRNRQRNLIAGVRLQLLNAETNISSAFPWLDRDDRLEDEINRAMHQPIEAILKLLLDGASFDSEFETVLGSLRGKSGGEDFELF